MTITDFKCTICQRDVSLPIEDGTPLDIVAAIGRIFVCDGCAKHPAHKADQSPRPSVRRHGKIEKQDLWYNRD